MKQFECMKYGMSMKAIVILGLMVLLAPSFVKARQPSDFIVGKWISSQGNLIVEIYKDSNTFSGRVLWFDDSDDKSYPMSDRTDKSNPDVSLRDQKIIGLIVLKNLTYDAHANRWENGKIYDVQSGKEWDSSVWLTKEGLLKVKGFWHFELFGKTMTFKRN